MDLFAQSGNSKSLKKSKFRNLLKNEIRYVRPAAGHK